MKVAFTLCVLGVILTGAPNFARSESCPLSQEVTLTMGGDVMIGRYMGSKLRLR